MNPLLNNVEADNELPITMANTTNTELTSVDHLMGYVEPEAEESAVEQDMANGEAENAKHMSVDEHNAGNSASPGSISLMQSSPPPASYRHSRAYRHFKNPPQPHMCIRTTTEAGEELFINVLSWTRIVIPQEPSDPIPLYGGMRVPPGSPRSPPIVFAVMANPEVLKDSGRHSKDAEERRAMVELMCDFVEAMNPGVKLIRNALILKDRDISGELKDVWNAVQAQRDREREEQIIQQRQQQQYVTTQQMFPKSGTSPTTTTTSKSESETTSEMENAQSTVINLPTSTPILVGGRCGSLVGSGCDLARTETTISQAYEDNAHTASNDETSAGETCQQINNKQKTFTASANTVAPTNTTTTTASTADISNTTTTTTKTTETTTTDMTTHHDNSRQHVMELNAPTTTTSSSLIPMKACYDIDDIENSITSEIIYPTPACNGYNTNNNEQLNNNHHHLHQQQQKHQQQPDRDKEEVQQPNLEQLITAKQHQQQPHQCNNDLIITTTASSSSSKCNEVIDIITPTRKTTDHHTAINIILGKPAKTNINTNSSASPAKVIVESESTSSSSAAAAATTTTTTTTTTTPKLSNNVAQQINKNITTTTAAASPLPTPPICMPTKREKLGSFLPKGCIFPRLKNSKNKDKDKEKDKDKDNKTKDKDKTLLNALKKSKDKRVSSQDKKCPVVNHHNQEKLSTSCSSQSQLQQQQQNISFPEQTSTNKTQYEKNCINLENDMQNLDINKIDVVNNSEKNMFIKLKCAATSAVAK